MAITGIDTIEGKQIIAAGAVSAKSAEMAYNDENGNPITGYQVAGDYYSASNPSGFITGVDLTPYQTTAGMTAYQPVGDYYSASNPSGFITGVPAGTMNESAFEYDANDKISGYNGSAFAAGSDVPEGVMVESGIEYNAVNEISGYNGSAIAQYGAEKQWLVHDDTLVHAANSAQYALGVNLSAVAQLLGVDETVLFSSTNTVRSANLSESITAFKRMGVMLIDDHKCERYVVADTNYPYAKWFSNYGFDSWNMGTTAATLRLVGWSANADKITSITGWQKNCNLTAANVTWNAGQSGVYGNIKYVIGIGRKEV